ncbi:MAG: metal-dependent transcriptional regulator [Candidatus Lokiarchaeota archaeon]
MSSNTNQQKLSDIPESYQRYLDEIYRIASQNKGGWVSNKEIALSLNVEAASVSGMLEKLKREGLIKWKPRKAIRLTEKGRCMAQQLSESHLLLRKFFKEVLKLRDESIIENLSCEIEHHLTEPVTNSLKKFLKEYERKSDR